MDAKKWAEAEAQVPGVAKVLEDIAAAIGRGPTTWKPRLPRHTEDRKRPLVFALCELAFDVRAMLSGAGVIVSESCADAAE